VIPVAISVDTPEESRTLCDKAHYTFPFLSDRDAKTIKQYGLLHKGGGMEGRDIARPAEYLVDKSGTIRWANLTEDLRVRARPVQMLEAADQLR